MSDEIMNWVDETQCSVHSGGEPMNEPAERSVSIDVGLNSKIDYGYMHVSVMADGVEDLPAAIAMVQAALAQAPAEFTAEDDESSPMAEGGMMG